MFTGIIEHHARVEEILKKPNLNCLRVKIEPGFHDVRPGESVALNGVCLTVASVDGDVLNFDVMSETLNRTSIGYLQTGDKLNAERALTLGSRLGGHFVTGHVDALSRILERVDAENYTELKIMIPDGMAAHFVSKGSVAIDGVSLTVGDVRANDFSVHLIPLTKQWTTLGAKRKGDGVNIETDLLAKYVLKGQLVAENNSMQGEGSCN